MPWRMRSGCISASTWLRFTQGSRRLLIFVPASPSNAGSNVIAAITETATTTADAKPMVVTVGMPATTRPQIAITTVVPANTTAMPDVPLAWPGRIGDRHPGRHLLAVTGDDEQRVVDADAEPDHRGDRGGDLGDVEEVGEHRDRREADEQSDERGADRHAHRDDRAERDQQHDHRGDEAVDLGAAEVGTLTGARDLAAELDLQAGVARGLHRVFELGEVLRP